MEEEFNSMYSAVYAAIMDTQCKDPIDAVMALCAVMCDILVQIDMDNTENVCESVSKTLELARQAYAEQEIH